MYGILFKVYTIGVGERNMERLTYLISNKVEYADLPYKASAKRGINDILPKEYRNYILETEKYGFNGKAVCEGLESARSLYRSSKDDAYYVFNQVMDIIKEDVMEVSQYCNKFIGDTYYRGRVCDNSVLSEKKEMFHIPFSNGTGSTVCRYSMEGESFLYLGGTTYTCYMELGQPEDISNLYFSRYEIPKDLKILSVGILPYEMLEFIYIEENQNECFESETLLRHYINMLPLIMACSVKKADKENKSKQNLKGECPEEYYIPQLLTRWVVENLAIYDGIEYFSTQVPTHSKRNYKLYRNLVLIAKREGTEEYSSKLSSKLKLTKPVRVKEDINLFSEYGEKDIPFLNQRAFPSGYNKKEIVNYVRNKGIYPFYKAAGRIQHNKNSNAELHYSSSGFNLIEFDLSKEKLGCIVSGR